jgi:putative aldouronate transport system permease protein
MWVRRRIGFFDIVNYAFFVAISLTFLFPLVMTLAISFSESLKLGNKPIGVWPIGFTLDSYKLLLSDGRILRYYLNTILYATTGTAVMLFSTSLMSYPLTFKDFQGKTLVTILLTITMFFGGGLIPYYLVVLKLGLINTLWALILPGAISAWNVFIFRTFFSSIPDSLRESAWMDGAGHFMVLFRIIVPLSLPLLATFTLFSVVGFWNDFFNALIFLRTQDKQPVQLFLRRILVLMDFKDVQNAVYLKMFVNLSSRTVKGAAVIITIIPILCVYPFLQKYFAKGIMVGAIKA